MLSDEVEEITHPFNWNPQNILEIDFHSVNRMADSPQIVHMIRVENGTRINLIRLDQNWGFVLDLLEYIGLLIVALNDSRIQLGIKNLLGFWSYFDACIIKNLGQPFWIIRIEENFTLVMQAQCGPLHNFDGTLHSCSSDPLGYRRRLLQSLKFRGQLFILHDILS